MKLNEMNSEPSKLPIELIITRSKRRMQVINYIRTTNQNMGYYNVLQESQILSVFGLILVLGFERKGERKGLKRERK